ncbi:MAG: prepilin peptidase [Planctomycetes bacterium]|nr:prepilin peptidase [Planctomycetota bacterium]
MPLWPWLIFISLYGACVGSFLNVVIYRLPEGKSLAYPPSSCPKCGTRLAWYDNVPVLGWLWLLGKCRYCRNPISIQYPIIEAVTAALFGATFWAYYMSGWQPAWQLAGGAETWPVLIVHLTLLGGLLASTIVDARLYIIPLAIPWFVTVVAVVALPLTMWALPGGREVLPIAQGPWLGGTACALVGLAIAVALLETGILPRSFADEYETETAGDGAPPPTGELAAPSDMHSATEPTALPGDSPMQATVVLDISTDHAPPVAVDVTSSPDTGAGAIPAPNPGGEMPTTFAYIPPDSSELTHRDILTDPGVAAYPIEVVPPAEQNESNEPITDHPHLIREILKEALFVALPLVGFVIGFLIWQRLVPPYPWAQPKIPAAWHVLGGVALGYLVGGALIWFTRILGSLAFQKEAMGLGDVHLLAAIGAVLGWPSAVLVFFIAPFLGLGYAGVSIGVGKLLHGHSRVIPYGPYLAAATLIVMARHWPWLDM